MESVIRKKCFYSYPPRLFFLPLRRKKRAAVCHNECALAKGLAPIMHRRECPVKKRHLLRLRKERYMKRGIPAEDASVIIFSAPYKNPAMRAMRHYVANPYKAGGCALLSGKEKSGKGFACSFLIAHRGGRRIKYEALLSLLQLNQHRLEEFANLPCLAITEVSKERWKEKEGMELLKLLQKRKKTGMPTILTSSSTLEELTSKNKKLHKLLAGWCYWYRINQQNKEGERLEHISYPILNNSMFFQ